MRVLVTAVLAVLIATSPAAAFERVGDRKILVFAGRQEVPTIDPSVKYDWSIRMAQQSLYDALVKYVGNPPEIVPWLAEKWESSPDARTWTFHLAKHAKFNNGDPVTAEAVRFSFARGAQPPYPEWGAMISHGRNYLPTWWWYSAFPGLFIYLTVLGFNLLGDGLRDILDPQNRG
jgi:ABC-type transport system substrate-binding protein